MSPDLRAKLKEFDPTLPLERARTIPSSWYLDPEIYELEREWVFGRTWQAVARSGQLSRPGAFVTADLAGEPILVVRDDQGQLRAFYNVCRHRAAQLVTLPEGQLRRLRCRYHGWTYDLNGRLRGTPEFDGVADFCRDDYGLVELAVDCWGPLVFVHAAPSLPLQDFLAPLPQRTATLNLEGLRFAERREYFLNCNWKVFVDNYLDGGYHIHTVHPGLAGAIQYTHYRTETFGHSSVQIAPLKAADDPVVGTVRRGDTAYYWWIFPNLMINIYQGVMDTNLVLPLGPERCRVVFDFYFADTEGAAARRFIADSVAVAHQIQLEDMQVCEEVQRGLQSRSYRCGRFSVRREGGGYHFHQLLARYLWASQEAQ
jgi:choline monooxygenase